MATRTHSTPVLTRRAALVGAAALSTLAPFSAAAATSGPTPEYAALRRLAAREMALELIIAEGVYGERTPELIEQEGIQAEIEVLIEDIKSRPVVSLSDLVNRAAIVLYWSDGGRDDEAWADPVGHFKQLGQSRYKTESEPAHFAATVFEMCGFSAA